jgi:hypothetical protein
LSLSQHLSNSNEAEVARAGRLIYDGLLIMWDGFWIIWLSNLFWLLLIIPVITIPFAFAGLYTCAHGLVHGESLEWQSFFTGTKKYFGASLRWSGANLLVFFVLTFYTWFFSLRGNNLTYIWRNVGSLFIVLALLWSVLNMYTFPFMLVQTKPSYLNAVRNSVVLFIKWPGQAFGFTLFNLLVIVLSLWLRFPWLLFGASLPALMSCLCVKEIVDQVNKTNLVES